MKEWYFDVAEFEPEVGFEFSFSAGRDKDSQYLHLCKVIEVIPEKKLSYSWRYDNLDGFSIVTFQLFEEGDKTKVKLTHEGLESFKNAGPDFTKESFATGWTHIIGTALGQYVETNAYGISGAA